MNRFLTAVLLWTLCAGMGRAGERLVNLEKTPGQGIQPQVATDAQGTVHMLYFQGDPRGGDLFYVRRAAGQSAYTNPLRVNSQAGSAIAVGTIRGGHVALGKQGRVHVAWNGSGKAVPKNPLAGVPMLYARLNDAGTAFEPQRNLMTRSAVLDGGGTLAADELGNVLVAWHGLGQDLAKGESNRKVWIACSRDEGKTFVAEVPAWNEPTGACGCCGMRGFTDQRGNAYFFYRAATNTVNRGMYLLQSTDHGKSFTGLALDKWNIGICPMSSEAFAEGPNGVVGAWENDGQIYFTQVQSAPMSAAAPKAAPGTARDRKHPALAVNKDGAMLLVWTEGTGWNRGGGLAWQVYDKAGNPTADAGRRPGAIPVWGLPAAFAGPDGRFTIVH